MEDWRSELARLASTGARERQRHREGGIGPDAVARQFLRRTGMDVLRELAAQLCDVGRQVEVTFADEPARAIMEVYLDGEQEFRYVLRVRRRGDMAFAYSEASYTSLASGKRYTYERYIGGHQLDHTITKVTREEIISDFMDEYRHVRSQGR